MEAYPKKSLAFYFVLLVSLLLGLLLGVMSMPADYSHWRPQWLCLLVMLWVLNEPNHLGLGFAWTVGLLQDVVVGSVWGAHALALTVLAYVCLLSYQRMRNYSVLHQSMWVFVFVGLHQLLVSWVQGIAGYTSSAGWLLATTFVSALLWPPMLGLVHRVQVTYQLR